MYEREDWLDGEMEFLNGTCKLVFPTTELCARSEVIWNSYYLSILNVILALQTSVRYLQFKIKRPKNFNEWEKG